MWESEPCRTQAGKYPPKKVDAGHKSFIVFLLELYKARKASLGAAKADLTNESWFACSPNEPEEVFILYFSYARVSFGELMILLIFDISGFDSHIREAREASASHAHFRRLYSYHWRLQEALPVLLFHILEKILTHKSNSHII